MTDREHILELQVKALEDRLAIALSIMLDCEIVCAADGDIESANWWEEAHNLLIRNDNEALEYLREEQRKFGFYKSSVRRIRHWLARGVHKALKAAA